MSERDRRPIQSTQIDLQTILRDVRNFDEIQTAIRMAIVKEGFTQVGFVSGPIASNSKEHRYAMKDSMNRMQEVAEQLHTKHNFPIISSTSIFRTVWKGLPETQPDQKELLSENMKNLFRGILKGGVTDLFVMSGWENAPGCVDEVETAKQNEIHIHFLET